MAGTSPLGTPYPSLGDASNVPSDVSALVANLDPKTVPQFSTTAQRDSARSALLALPTAKSFSMCFVGTALHVWDGAAWTVYMKSPIVKFGSMMVTLSSGVATATIDFNPDFPGTPGFSCNTTAITNSAGVVVNITGLNAGAASVRLEQKATPAYNGNVTLFWMAIYQP